MVNFPTWIPDFNSYSPALLDSFLSSYTTICSTMAFPPLGNSDHVVSVPMIFCQILNGMPYFIAQLMTILKLIGAVFMIFWEIFHRRISLNSMPLLLLVNFVSGFKLDLMYIYLIISIMSSLTHLYGFQLLLQPQSIEITFFICTNRINLQDLK